MTFSFAPLTPEKARDLVCWQYEAPYDVYTIVQEPADTAEIAKQAAYFMQPDVHGYGISAETHDLIAFCTFGPDGRVPGGDYSADALDIGLGVRPDWTGKGAGKEIVSAVIEFARLTFAPAALRVTIAESNIRAQRVWMHHDFIPQQRFAATAWTKKPFLILGREAAR